MSDATGAPGRKAVCWLCPHRCHLSDGQTGFCRARQNQGGIIRSLSYGLLTSAALDPIEKKPLYHFRPGSMILSLGSFGCNLRCPFCQNYTISQAGRDGFEGQQLPMDRTSPKEIVAAAQRLEETSGNIGVAFTYNEPLVGYEFVYDTARLLKEAGLAVVLVTNGQIEKAPGFTCCRMSMPSTSTSKASHSRSTTGSAVTSRRRKPPSRWRPKRASMWKSRRS